MSDSPDPKALWRKHSTELIPIVVSGQVASVTWTPSIVEDDPFKGRRPEGFEDPGPIQVEFVGTYVNDPEQDIVPFWDVHSGGVFITRVYP